MDKHDQVDVVELVDEIAVKLNEIILSMTQRMEDLETECYLQQIELNKLQKKNTELENYLRYMKIINDPEIKN